MMSILKKIFNGFKSESPVQYQRQSYTPRRNLTPEEYVIFKQEESGEEWHGVPLHELSKIAKNTYRGRYVRVDEYNFLVFYYSSNSKKTKFATQCKLDENGQLIRMSHSYYPNQWRDSADDFVEKVNQLFVFR